LLLLGALATIAFATIVLVVVPQLMLREVPVPAGLVRYTASQQHGREVYVREGCVYCHSQQVRDPAFTTDIARGWGSRATVPADYVYDRPHLLGTMRTGPDLVNVGQRLPDRAWHLLHLYNPRAVVSWSIMPSFTYLFTVQPPAEVTPGQITVPVQGQYAPKGGVVVAGADAIALVDYLMSLKRQYPIPALMPSAAPARDTGEGRTVHTMP
jgi:cytochrome c oxidase cbb3-type subunit 2